MSPVNVYVVTGVSFSIKTKDDEAPTSLKNRVILEESSSDDEGILI